MVLYGFLRFLTVSYVFLHLLFPYGMWVFDVIFRYFTYIILKTFFSLFSKSRSLAWSWNNSNLVPALRLMFDEGEIGLCNL